jgi:hypothetical protein
MPNVRRHTLPSKLIQMTKNTKRAVAILLTVAVVLATNPELLALILTVQAIGVETALLLLTLQARSLGGALGGVVTYIFILIGSASTKLSQQARLLLNLCPRPEHPFVLSQLTLLLCLRVRAIEQGT